MKLPLRVEKSQYCTDFDWWIRDADENVIVYSDHKDALDHLVALANSHAAQPGPPREDGSWIIRTEGGQEHIAYKRFEIRGRWYWECVGRYIAEEVIVAHRKHTPLEVPK